MRNTGRSVLFKTLHTVMLCWSPKTWPLKFRFGVTRNRTDLALLELEVLPCLSLSLVTHAHGGTPRRVCPREEILVAERPGAQQKAV